MNAIKWFYTFFKKYRVNFTIGIILTTMGVVLSIVNPYIAGSIVDDVIYGKNYDLLPNLVVILVCVTAIIGTVRFFLQVQFELSSQGILYDMRQAIYHKLLEEDFTFYNKKRTGDLMSRQTGDMDAIRHFIANTIYTAYQQVLFFVFALLMVFTINAKIALCMMIVLPFSAYTTYLQSKQVRPAFQRNRECYTQLNSFAQENISGNRVIKAFTKEDYEIKKFSVFNDNFRNAQVNAAKIWKNYVPIFEIFAYMLTVILMGMGGYMTIKGEITVGNLVQINGYLWMLNQPLRMFSWKINEIQNFLTSLDKIYDTYSEEPHVKNPYKGFKRTDIKGDIEFKNVSYSADDEVIVKDISFKVKAGQTIGIIGSTGSGKSTLMNLLCRFYDTTDGTVLVDDRDVKTHNLYNLRDHIGMAMQDVFLFSDTIEGNIAYGRPDCPFDHVKDAAIRADANHFIQGMPDGYDTIIGERGMGLSGGQKQRISLARALLKDPSILILDDTTSAVDMETESYIQTQLKKLEGECTIFVIAYRISSIKDADLILVMDQGRIIEQGTHDSLVQSGGYYASAFKNQYGDIPYELLNEKNRKNN
ncbi:MAG: ABC transporter ATP-binding protein [Lachnospiraceae bacterium]